MKASRQYTKIDRLTRLPTNTESLLDELRFCMLEDRFRLVREIKHAATAEYKYGNSTHDAFDRLTARVNKSKDRAEQRAKDVPAVTVPSELPISLHQEKISNLIQKNPVVIVCGETGSGKSTQIPKICLRAGFGIHGMICQTQPRRIAARSVAERISDEIGSVLGRYVGYRVRFSEQVSEGNYLRVLTDGMLLAEFARYPDLNRYEVLIVDEAHERSLNIDFLLGLAKRIITKRPEFRLIITSATLDTEKYSKHFDDAPTVTVSGRTYPVECRYRPLGAGDKEVDVLPEAINSAIHELHGEAPGDVLVFLPGEREIRETSAWLENHLKQGIEILPLYSRLTQGAQHRIFHPGARSRIILATNVAETSITVPGIRYVIDSGLARISRYSATRKLQRLPLEKISKASADQRAGRCGRVSNGVCIRLYDEDDYLNRSLYTDPEIQRTSLADVILRMKSMGIGEIETFPFIDRPGRRQINDGLQHLVELGALDQRRTITNTGRQIARIPVDPRVARMLLAARILDCLEEIVVIASALSLPDPRNAPADKLQHARQVHRQISKETSDFLVLLDIWRQYRQIQKKESKRKSHRWCERNYLSVFRMREWGALQASLKRTLKQLEFQFNQRPSDKDTIHRALLPGLLSNVAQLKINTNKNTPKQKSGRRNRRQEYDGTFGKTLQIFPASVLRDNPPKWIMSAELVETGQVYARTVAGLNPQWLESAAEHLLQYHYSAPSWDRRQERVVALRRATLYGLTVYSGRKCDYSKINSSDCRMIFIRSALVDGGLDSRMPFYVHNRNLVGEIESLEHRTRRRDILVDDTEIYQFYDEVIPQRVCSASDLRKWHRSLDEGQKSKLLIPRKRLMLSDPDQALKNFPDEIENSGIPLSLDYLFDPASERDGVTAQIPLPLLNKMNGATFERVVPGLLLKKLVLLARTLPKQIRRRFVPIPDTVDQVAEAVSVDPRPLSVSLAEALGKLKGIEIDPNDFDFAALPEYLKLGLEVVDDRQRAVGFSRDLEGLQSEHGLRAHASFVAKGDPKIERRGIKKWDFDKLPETVTVKVGSYKTDAYPAMVDCADSVAIEIFDCKNQADQTHTDGVRRLLWLNLPAYRKLVRKPIPEWQRISLMYASIGDLSSLQAAMFNKAQDQVFFRDKAPVRSRMEFEQLLNNAAPKLPNALAEIAGFVADALIEYRAIKKFMDEHQDELPQLTTEDVETQLEWLIYDGFVEDIPVEWLRHLPRFLRAIMVRLEQAILDPDTDRLRLQKVSPWWNRYMGCEFEYSNELESWRWMLEEYRVSVFAQGLKTSMRISSRRLDQAWRAIDEYYRTPIRV